MGKASRCAHPVRVDDKFYYTFFLVSTSIDKPVIPCLSLLLLLFNRNRTGLDIAVNRKQQ